MAAKKYSGSKTLDLQEFTRFVVKTIARICPKKMEVNEQGNGVSVILPDSYSKGDFEPGDSKEIRIAFRVAQEKKMGSVLKASVRQSRHRRKARTKTFKWSMFGDDMFSKDKLRSIDVAREICEYLSK